MIKRLGKLTCQEVERLQYLGAYQPCITKEIDFFLKAKNWVVIEGDDGTSFSETSRVRRKDGRQRNLLYDDNGSVLDFWRLEDPDDAAARAEAKIETTILPW
jgi:hypothetical protein